MQVAKISTSLITEVDWTLLSQEILLPVRLVGEHLQCFTFDKHAMVAFVACCLSPHHGMAWYNLKLNDVECYTHARGSSQRISVSVRRRELHKVWRRWQAA